MIKLPITVHQLLTGELSVMAMTHQPGHQRLDLSEITPLHHMKPNAAGHGLSKFAETRLAQMALAVREEIQWTDPLRQQDEIGRNLR